MLTGTLLSGIAGALLAVPLVAFLNSTIHALRDSPALPVGRLGLPGRGTHQAGGDPVDLAERPDDSGARAEPRPSRGRPA